MALASFTRILIGGWRGIVLDLPFAWISVGFLA